MPTVRERAKHLPVGVAFPPDTEMHARHLKKLESFLREVSRSPQQLEPLGSPVLTLFLFFLVSGFPYEATNPKKGALFCNMITGLPRHKVAMKRLRSGLGPGPPSVRARKSHEGKGALRALGLI